MKKSKLQNVLYLIMWILELASLTFAVATVWRMDMLPDQYMMILVVAAVAVWALTGLLFLPSGKQGGGKIRRGFASVLTLVVVIICAVLTTVATVVYQAMHNIVDDPTDDAITRGIYVRADDPAQTLADTRNYTFAKVTGYDVDYIKEYKEFFMPKNKPSILTVSPTLS